MKSYLLYWLEDQGAALHTEVQYNEVNKEGLVITTKDGMRKTLPADTIITALPLKPSTEFSKTMAGKAMQVYTSGDAKEPGLTFNAAADGACIARDI